MTCCVCPGILCGLVRLASHRASSRPSCPPSVHCLCLYGCHPSKEPLHDQVGIDVSPPQQQVHAAIFMLRQSRLCGTPALPPSSAKQHPLPWAIAGSLLPICAFGTCVGCLQPVCAAAQFLQYMAGNWQGSQPCRLSTPNLASHMHIHNMTHDLKGSFSIA